MSAPGAEPSPEATRLAGRHPARASRTRTRMRSTARCAGARTAPAARSGPGARTCTRSPTASPPTATTRWRAPSTRRWRWPASPVSASSTTCTTTRRRPYADANAFGEALIAAAADAGIRITLLDACYLAGGIGRAAAGASAALRRRRRGSAGPSERRTCAALDTPVWAPRSTRCGPCPRRSSTTVVAWAHERGRRCTSTCPSNVPRTRPAWPRTAARRRSCSTTTARSGRGSCAVHATHLTDGRHRPARRLGHDDLHVPDDRARPRRRDRPRPSARRRRLAAVARQRQQRRRRPVRGGARGGAR